MPSKIKQRPELLLQVPIPRAMHGVSPRLIMGSRQWEKEKLIVRARTEGRCEACGRLHKDEVESHECYDIDYRKYTMTFKEVVGLCRDCHLYIHPGFLKSLIERGELTQREGDIIIDRGDRILAQAELSKVFPSLVFKRWSEWRLIFKGKEYQPKYKSEIEWRKRYAS